MLTPISSWNYGWKISKTNEKYERRLRRSTFAWRLVAVRGIAGDRSLRPQHRWRRHTDDEPSRLRRRRRRTWRFGCRLLRPFVVWRPAAPVKRRHAFPLESEGIASKKNSTTLWSLETQNSHKGNAAIAQARKRLKKPSWVRKHNHERKKESHSVEAKNKMALFELTQTPLLLKAPHTNKQQTNKQ